MIQTEEMYFRRSDLAMLFSAFRDKHREDGAVLAELWECVKQIPMQGKLIEKNCEGTCENCNIRELCKIIDEIKPVLEKYRVIGDTDSYWSGLVNESCRVIEQHQNSKAAKTIVHDLLYDLSEISRTSSIEGG